MPLPICIEIPEIPDPFQITLPGGVTMEHINLMEVIQPALTPLVPLFNIIDTVVAVFNCIKAIPDTLGPPPDPTAIAACIPELAEKVFGLSARRGVPRDVGGLTDVVGSPVYSTGVGLVKFGLKGMRDGARFGRGVESSLYSRVKDRMSQWLSLAF